MNRAELLAALQAADIEVPAAANVAALRALYTREIVNRNRQNDDEENRERRNENNENRNDEEHREHRNDNEDEENRDRENDDRNADLNRRLIELRQREELLQLQARIRALEAAAAVDVVHVNAPRLERVVFTDLECVPKFTGDDTYSVHRFVAAYTDAIREYHLGERDQYSFACRKLDGSAAIFLRGSDVRTWNDLRDALVVEFGESVSRQEVYARLSRRRHRREETIHRYVLVMREIASQADIEESELVQFIVDGLDDRTNSVSMLYGARSFEQLRELLPVFERRRARLQPTTVRPNATVPTGTVNNRTSTETAKPNFSPNAAAGAAPSPRCFNCRQFGHLANACPKPKRPEGSCFTCHEMGHLHNECPKRRRVAAINENQSPDWNEATETSDNREVDELANDLAALQMVSFSVCIGKDRQDVSNILALFDTGSPVSFVCKSNVPMFIEATPLKRSKYSGVGGAHLYTQGELRCRIRFRGIEHELTVFVLPDDSIPTPMLLGRDFLDIFGIGLKFKIRVAPKRASLPHLISFVDSNQINFVYHSVFGTPSVLTSQFLPDSVSSSCPASDSQPQVNTRFDFDTANIDELLERFVNGIRTTSQGGGDASTIEVGASFGPDLRRRCLQLVESHYVSADRPEGSAPKERMRLRLTSDVPLYCPPRRLSYAERDEVARMVDDLMVKSVVRPSKSPYASPIVLVRKKSGEKRMCVDYRGINKLTVRDSYPLPLIEDCLEYLDGKNCFSILDLRNGFHQMEMDPESIPYTAFVTPSGHYEYTRMPFGLKNGPAVFQRFIANIFSDMIRDGEIIVYIDDILIATVDPEENLRILARVLDRLIEYGLELKLEKCRFLQTAVDYLGYTVTVDGVRPNDSHIRAIRDYPVPRSPREVQSCLGLFSWFRRFVPNFSRIAAPMLNQLKKGNRFTFDQECVDSFRRLQSLLVAAPVLAIYNPARETELHTDASSQGFGAVLLQRQVDGRFHPVSYYSRRATAPESRYHSFELEALAVVYAVRRFRVYLSGMPFKIVTDCSALVLTMSKKALNPRIGRWAIELEEYWGTFTHRAGEKMAHVDALSRNFSVCPVTANETDSQLQVAQMRDPVIDEIRRGLEIGPVKHYVLDDGFVYRQMSDTHRAFYVPSDMEENVVRLVHEQIGHLGVDKCYDQIRLNYWFPSMHRKISSVIQNCIRCVMHTAPRRVNERTLHSIPKNPVPFDTLHIDHYGPLPNVSSKRKYILVVVDAFTKYVKLFAVNSTSTKEVCASLQKYFDFYGRPARIVSDQGTCFTSLEFSEFLLNRGIVHVKNASASPQANGQVERVNRVLTPMLGKLSEPVSHSNWSLMLTRVEYALNNSVHSTTRRTPSELLFGVRLRGPEVDELTEYLQDRVAGETERDLSAIRADAGVEIAKSQRRNEIQFAKRSRAPPVYEEGDFVVIRNVDTTIGVNKKLIPKYRGPYVIHKVLPNDRYVVRDIENCQLTQLPYDRVLEAARLRLWITAPGDGDGQQLGGGDGETLQIEGDLSGQAGRAVDHKSA